MDIDLNKLDRLKLDELKQIAKDLSIKSVSSYRKNDLIELIKDTYEDESLEEKNHSNEINDHNDNFDLG